MAIKHLPSGYKPLVNQCGVKFDVQRVCTEEDTGPQVLTLNWPSNVEQYALYAASCSRATGAATACGQYASMPDVSQVAAGQAPDSDSLIVVRQHKTLTFTDSGWPSNTFDLPFYTWTNNLGFPIRVLHARFFADGAVGTAPGGDASQGQNAINRAQGSGVVPAWEIIDLDTFMYMDFMRAVFAIRRGTASEFVWPKEATVPDSVPHPRQLWWNNPYDAEQLLCYDTGDTWWAQGGTAQTPIDSDGNQNFNPFNDVTHLDPLNGVVNPDEDVAFVLYQQGMTWFSENPPAAVFAPMTIEITYEQAEAHP